MSRIITTEQGQIEAEVVGSGCSVLVLHGSPGGIDAARAMCCFLPVDEFRCILVSRPGYLNTPLHPKSPTIDREADLLATLLDALDISKAAVLAWSGGGAAAYRLAVQHPTRVSAVVAIAALSHRWTAPKPNMAQRLMFGTRLGERVIACMCKHFPRHVVAGALEGEGSVRGEALSLLTEQVMADLQQRQLVLSVAETVSTAGRRRAGWDNDVYNFSRVESLDLAQISCPVLLIHGDADTDADIKYSKFAHEAIPRSELVIMMQGTHLCFYAHPEAAATQQRTRKWLLEHCVS